MSPTSVGERVTRILARLAGFSSGRAQLPADIELRSEEQMLGRYFSNPADSPVLFTTLGLWLTTLRGWRFVPYAELTPVLDPAKDPPPTRITIRTRQGEDLHLPVRADARTSDAFELLRFLDRVRADAQPSAATAWSHPSVRALAGTGDPIEVITERARSAVFNGIEAGWSGPPFDPMGLARLRGIELRPQSDLEDASLVAVGQGFRIEYNPNRPPARIRYSVAHELAHGLFPDAAARTRHRGRDADEWQLELLCNIAAAELLMPTGSLGHALEELPFGVEAMLALRERFLVSLEAVAIRLARTSADPVAAFAARHASDESGGHFEIEYAIPSPAWRIPRLAGRRVPPDSIIGDVSAVGFTARSSRAESWGNGVDAIHVEAVGAPPYPDGVRPRVVGLLWPSDSQPSRAGIHYERGDALSPIGSGSKLIAHVVNDKAAAWGGRSFAAQVRAKWPAVQASFKTWAAEQGLHLGAIHVAEAQDHIRVVSMVAQHGYRPASRPLIRYDALQRALGALADLAVAEGASVHMPRIGTGNAGGNWEFIGGLVEELVVARGIHVTVYDFPSPDPTRSGALRQATR